MLKLLWDIVRGVGRFIAVILQGFIVILAALVMLLDKDDIEENEH
jgi:hypothetical protein